MDDPQHQEVGRDAQEHVDELKGQVPNENCRHVFAVLIHRLFTAGAVVGSVRDEEHRGVHVENLHGVWNPRRRSSEAYPRRRSDIKQKRFAC